MKCSPALLIDNAWLGAALSATPAIADLENTQQLRRGTLALTASNSSQVINFDFSQPQTVSMFWAALATDADMTLELFGGANQSGALLFSAALPKGRYIPAGTWRAGVDAFGAYDSLFSSYRPYYFTAVSAQSGRLTITSASPSVKAIPLVVLGDAWQPDYGASIGMAVSLKSSAQTVRTRGGSLAQLGLDKRWRELALDLARLTGAERVDFYNRLAVAGGFGVLVDALPADSSELRVQHLLLANVQADFVNNGSYHSAKLTFVEI